MKQFLENELKGLKEVRDSLYNGFKVFFLTSVRVILTDGDDIYQIAVLAYLVAILALLIGGL